MLTIVYYCWDMIKKMLVLLVDNYKLPDEETDDLTKPYEQFNVNPMS